MLKKFGFFASILIFMMLFNTAAFAASEETAEGDMTVSFFEETEKANNMMNIDVICPGYTYLDIFGEEQAEFLDILAYRKQVVTDDNGNIDLTFSLRPDSPSGIYTFVVTGKGYKNETKVMITNKQKAQIAVLVIGEILASEESNADKQAKIKAELKSNLIEFGIDTDGYSKAFNDTDWDNVTSLAFLALEKEENPDADKLKRVFNKAISVVALENEKVLNIILDSELFDLKSGELAEWYRKDYVTDSVGERMAERLSGKSFDSFSDFDEALVESFVLSVVENPDGWGNAKEVIQGFSDYIGTGESGKDKRYEYVSYKNWDSFSDLKEAFDNYEEKKPSGGSSGGGTGKRPSAPTMPIIPTPDTEKSQETDKKIYPLTIFKDLDNVAWADEAIVALAEKGIINGVGNDLFAPDRNITREEFTAMVVRAFINDAESKSVGFSDVSENSWYYTAVSKAYGAGIITGESDAVFGTGKKITRQDMAVILYRVSKYINSGITDAEELSGFSDDEKIADYAKAGVYTFKVAGIINGVSETEFAPLDFATRAQAAKMIYGLMNF